MSPNSENRTSAPGTPGMSRRRASLTPLSRDMRFGILALAVPSIALFGVLAFAITLSPQFRALDRQVSMAIRLESGSAGLIGGFSLVTWLGSAWGIATVAVVAVLSLVAFRHWRGAFYALATLVPGWLFGVAVKEIIDRARPMGALIPLPPDASFPSGHALSSFLLYGSLAVLAAAWVRTDWLRWTLVGLAGAAIVAIGLSRVVLGVHFFADVLGSWLLGFAWLVVTSSVYLALEGPGDRRG